MTNDLNICLFYFPDLHKRRSSHCFTVLKSVLTLLIVHIHFDWLTFELHCKRTVIKYIVEGDLFSLLVLTRTSLAEGKALLS